MPIVATRAASPSGGPSSGSSTTTTAAAKKAKRRSLFGLGRKQTSSDSTDQPPLPTAASPTAASFAAASSSSSGVASEASAQDAWKAERNAGEQAEWQLERARGRQHEEEMQQQQAQYEATQRRAVVANGSLANGTAVEGNDRAYVGYDDNDSEEDAQLAYSTAPQEQPADDSAHFTFPSRSASYDEVSYAAAAAYTGYAPRPRQGSAPAAGLRHERARSHFSIPDVVITACEEDGEVSRVELAVPVQKRRSFVFTHILPSAAGHVSNGAAYEHERALAASPTSTLPARKMKLQKPKPLIRLDSDGRGGTLPTMAGQAAALQDQPPYSPTTTTSPTSSPASSWGKGAGASAAAAGATLPKRTRKSSFPSLMFGKRDKSAQQQEEMPADAATRAAAQQRQSQEAEAAAARSATPVQRSAPAALPSAPEPPPTGLRAARAQSKKLAKAREKEESQMMRELEKVNKMVRAHDAKQDKVRAKEAKRKTLLLAKEASVPAELRVGNAPLQQQQQQQKEQQPGAAVKALRRITMFSAGNKSGTATPGVQLVRKNSALRRAPGAPTSGATTPTKPKARDETRWAAVRQSPPRTKRAGAGSDESERSSATSGPSSASGGGGGGVQDWTDVSSPVLNSMQSLAHPNGPSVGTAGGAQVQRKSSIQRALAMSEAESAMLRRKTSLNRRGSQSRLNSAGTGATTPKHRGSPNGSISGGVGGVARKRSLVRRDRDGEVDRQMGWEEEVEAGLERVQTGHADDGISTPRAGEYAAAAAARKPASPARRTDAAKANAAAAAAAAIDAGSAPRLPYPLSGRVTPAFGDRFDESPSGSTSSDVSPLSFSRPFRAGEADSQPTPTVTITSPPHSPVSPVSPGARLPGGHPSGFTFPPRPPREQRRAGTLPNATAQQPPSMTRSDSVPQLQQ